jgi:large subunit ribosomal protein L4
MAKTLNVYSAKKATKDTMQTPKEFSEAINEALLAHAIHVYQDRRHPGLSKAQTRGEVSLTKAKMYRQKGTGNARHGAASAPIFVGGGKAHGPKGVKRVLEMPKKMRQKALKVAWAAKQSEDKVVIVSDLGTIKNTKGAQELIDKIVQGEGKEGWRKMTLFLSDSNAAMYRYFKNIKAVHPEKYANANAYSVFRGGLVVVDQEALQKTKRETVKKTAKSKKTEK